MVVGARIKRKINSVQSQLVIHEMVAKLHNDSHKIWCVQYTSYCIHIWYIPPFLLLLNCFWEREGTLRDYSKKKWINTKTVRKRKNTRNEPAYYSSDIRSPTALAQRAREDPRSIYIYTRNAVEFGDLFWTNCVWICELPVAEYLKEDSSLPFALGCTKRSRRPRATTLQESTAATHGRVGIYLIQPGDVLQRVDLLLVLMNHRTRRWYKTCFFNL